MRSISVRHNFEAAHRLPLLGGKCTNLHGHSWWATVTVSTPALDGYGTIVEFGGFKAHMRAWIDTNLDHGAMLGNQDPLAKILLEHGCKVFRFGYDWPGADWPTVEAVAEMIADRAAMWLPPEPPDGTHIARVVVTETHVNAAEWEAPAPRVTVREVWSRATQPLRESA
jgi:6-pyruvoyltetrahydropterin/6-carboxytetrahydropterin synthase